MKFCFLCGKKTEKLMDGYCEDCYEQKFQLVKVPKEITITLCSRCSRLKEMNKWKEINIGDVVKRRIKILGDDIEIEMGDEYTKLCVKGFPKGSKKIKEENHDLKIKIVKETCYTCSRKAGKYFESTIQIRGKITDDDINSLDNIVVLRGGFYRLKVIKGGYDFLVSSKSLAKKMVEYFKKKYKVEIKKSFTLVTNKEGKNIYRDTVLLRIS